MRSEFGEEANILLDQFLRDMTRLRVGIFGMAWVGPEAPAVMVLRNRNNDPVEQAETMLEIIKDAAQDQRIVHSPVEPLN